MAIDIKPGESYTIRRKVLKVFGAAFHILDPAGNIVGFCRQKAFKLKEDIRIYTDETCSTELVTIKARSVVDFSATYDVFLGGSGEKTSLGTFQRQGMKSTFVRDHWIVKDRSGRQVAELVEQGGFITFARRYIDLIAALCPQQFALVKSDGAIIAAYRQHFNLFVYRLSIAVARDDPDLDDLVILAGGCLICAIEGRQRA